MEIYELNSCDEIKDDVQGFTQEIMCQSSLMAKNVDKLNKKDISLLINSDEFLKNRVIQDIIASMNRGEIKRSELNKLENQALKRKIKIDYVNQELGHLKVKIKLKELINAKDQISIRHARSLLLSEMMRIKDNLPNKIHKDYIKLYKQITKLMSQYDDVITNEEYQKIKWLERSDNFKDISNNKQVIKKKIIKRYKFDLPSIHERILECSENCDTPPNCLEEYLYNIEDAKERIQIEEQLLKYNERQMRYILELKNSLMSETQTKSQLKAIMKNCKHEMEKFRYKNIQPEWQMRYKDVFEECYAKLKWLNASEQEVSHDRKSFDYTTNRWGYLSKEIKEDINKRDKNNRTIFHNEAINNTDKDYVEYMVYLIKSGANITLRDDRGCTPMDYVDREKVRRIQKNLDAILKNWGKTSEVGLRVYRAKIELEQSLDNNTQNVKDYFNSLKSFVKEQLKTKSKEELEDFLSLHVYHDENQFLRQQREQYFKNQMKKNNENIKNIIQEMEASKKKNYTEYLKRETQYLMDNKLIQRYLLEDSSDRFKELKEEIITSIKILNNNNYGDEINQVLIDYVKQFLNEYPTQVNIMIDNKDILDELVKHKNIALIKVLINNGRHLNYYMANGKLPIEHALFTNDIPFVKKMIDLGVNLESVTKDGVKVTTLILDTHNKELIEYTIKDVDKAKNVYQSEDVSKILDIKDEELLKDLVNEGLNIDEEDEQGFNPLERAIITKDLEKSNKLINIGADSKKADVAVRALLKCEIEDTISNYPMKKFIKALKKEVPKVDDIEVRNYMAIASEYILDGKLKEVEKVIRECNEVLKRQNEGELNLLSQMIISLEGEEGLNKVVNIIKKNPYIINNIDVAANRINANTPIHYIIDKISQSNDAIIILNKILQHVTNAKVLDAKNKYGMTALDCAIAINNMEAIKMLYRKNMELKQEHIERKDNIIHLQYAMLNNNLPVSMIKDMALEVVKLRQETEKGVTFMDILNDNTIPNKQSMLHLAAYSNRDDIAKYLLEQDINLNIKDVGGRTPIYYAVVAKNLDMVTNLIIKDERVLNVVDIKNATPLHYAVLTQDENMVTLILAKSSKFLKVQDIEGRTAFHYAVLSQNVNIIKAILYRITNKGVINMQDAQGRTAFHYAALGRDVEILNCFVKNPNVRCNIEDCLGQKPVDYLLQGELKVEDVLDKFGNNIPSIIRQILARKDKKASKYSQNELHSACNNRISPKEAINIVLEEKEDEIVRLINRPLHQRTGKTPLDMAIENNVPQESLVQLITMGKILESKLKKDKLTNKLLEYNREEVAKSLGIQKDYRNKALKMTPNKLYNLIKSKATSQHIKDILGISQSVDCKGFELYDYAIIKDRYDWYCEFKRSTKDFDIEKVKDKVISSNSINMLEELLKDGQDFNDKTLWKKASKEARETIIKYISSNNKLEDEIKKASNQLNINMVKGMLELTTTPITGLMHIAVKKNSIGLAMVIMDYYGKDVFYEKDENGKTPCDLAKKIKNRDMLTYLIMNGAKIDLIRSNKLTLAETILNIQINLAKERATILSYDNNTFGGILSTMSRKEINKKDSLGNTWIFYAIRKNDREKVLSLVNKGAEINIRNKYGKTPIYIALKYASEDIVKDLVSRGANLDMQVGGKSMLHYAMKRVRSDSQKEITFKNSIAIKLMEKGVIDLTPSTINTKIRYDRIIGSNYVTQLMYHIMMGHKDIAQQLIQSEYIDLNQIDNEGFTAYGYAKHRKYQDLMELMKRKDENITDRQKQNQENTNIYKILGAGMTILGIAARRTNLGGIGYDLFENVLLDKGKYLLGESTKEIIEKIQDNKRKTEEKLKNIYNIKGVREGIEAIQDMVSKEDVEDT